MSRRTRRYKELDTNCEYMCLQVQISYLRGHVPTSKLHLRRLNNNNNGGNQSGTATGTATSVASEGEIIEMGKIKFVEEKNQKYKNWKKVNFGKDLISGSLTSTEPRSRSSDEPSDDWTVSRGGERRD